MKKIGIRFNKKNQILKLVLKFWLLIYLFAVIGNLQGLPLLITVDNSHKVSITKKNGKIHLVLDHVTNADEQDTIASEHGEHKHKHDLIAGLLAVIASERDQHPSHEIHIFNYSERVITKTAVAVKNYTFFISTQLLPKFIEVASLKRFPHFLPVVNFPLVSLRTTVLLT
jgi:hypothetical protein